MPARRGWLLLLLGLPLAGCFGSKDLDARCNDTSEYQASREAAPIAVPPNLKLPAQTSGYGVPAGTGQADGAACLARPPNYFRQAPGAPAQPGTASPAAAPAAAPPSPGSAPPAPPPGPGPAGAGPAAPER